MCPIKSVRFNCPSGVKLDRVISEDSRRWEYLHALGAQSGGPKAPRLFKSFNAILTPMLNTSWTGLLRDRNEAATSVHTFIHSFTCSVPRVCAGLPHAEILSELGGHLRVTAIDKSNLHHLKHLLRQPLSTGEGKQSHHTRFFFFHHCHSPHRVRHLGGSR